jgi:hypothetical protein
MEHQVQLISGQSSLHIFAKDVTFQLVANMCSLEAFKAVAKSTKL